MTIIVMTREMGTLGKDVAGEYSRRKGIGVIHLELIQSSHERLIRNQESDVYRFLEGSDEELDDWRDSGAKDGYLTAEEIYEIALEDNVLIRGWGATRLLSSVPNVLSVRVCAPMEFRTKQMMDRLGVGEREARHEIERSDAAHSRTFLRFFESDWRDPLNYDLVLNTAHLGPETCADILVDAASNPAFADSEATKKELQDRLLEARISSAIHSDESLGRKGQHIQIKIHEGDVRLYGVVTDGQSSQLAERIVAAQDGVKNVQNEISRISRYST